MKAVSYRVPWPKLQPLLAVIWLWVTGPLATAGEPSTDQGWNATVANRKQLALAEAYETALKAEPGSDDQRERMGKVFELSRDLLQHDRHRTNVWVVRAHAALLLEEPLVAWEAGRNLVRLGLETRQDEFLQGLLAEARQRLWLNDSPPTDGRDIAEKWVGEWTASIVDSPNIPPKETGSERSGVTTINVTARRKAQLTISFSSDKDGVKANQIVGSAFVDLNRDRAFNKTGFGAIYISSRTEAHLTDDYVLPGERRTSETSSTREKTTIIRSNNEREELLGPFSSEDIFLFPSVKCDLLFGGQALQLTSLGTSREGKQNALGFWLVLHPQKPNLAVLWDRAPSQLPPIEEIERRAQHPKANIANAYTDDFIGPLYPVFGYLTRQSEPKPRSRQFALVDESLRTRGGSRPHTTGPLLDLLSTRVPPTAAVTPAATQLLDELIGAGPAARPDNANKPAAQSPTALDLLDELTALRAVNLNPTNQSKPKP